MADFGLTDEGFNKKRLATIVFEIDAALKEIFGENFNVSPQSPDGQINGVIAGALADLWDIAEESFNAFNPSAATNTALSNLVQLNGITRFPAIASTAELSLTGSDGTVIAAGSLVETEDSNTQFSTDDEVTISAGTATVNCTAVNTGELSALAGTITVIVNPVTGWLTVTNAADAVEGQDEETDAELRARRENTFGLASQAMIDSIFAGLSVLPNVGDVSIIENDTSSVVGGVPAHSFETIISGGDDDAIAQVIFNRKPIGIEAFGTTTVSITDSQGFSHDIGFTRPTDIDIYISISLEVDDNYPGDGDDQIKQAIIDYAAGDLVPDESFGVGDDVIYSRLFTPINSVGGHSVTSLGVNDSGLPATETANIDITGKEISLFTESNIDISTTPAP